MTRTSNTNTNTNKQIGKKSKTVSNQSYLSNDMSNEEFDTYFQECLRRKQERELKADVEEMEKFMEDTEYYAIMEDEEIDRLFEEMERWSDF
jgi:hypothetical protein